MPTATEPLDALLRQLVERQSSDLHLKPLRPPLVRIDGRLTALDLPPLGAAAVEQMLDSIVPDRLRSRLSEELAIDFGYSLEGVSRFRVSIFCQLGTRAAVFRRVPYEFPSLEDLGLPEVLARLCEAPQGLVLITGPTGSGKSSTLAAMMSRIAATRPDHIVTIEDPIEFLIRDGRGSVSQREIGIDTPSFSVALRTVLRQDPDVIMVGEMRDEETIRTVLTAAETGHLVFSTLHTNGAAQTIDRIMVDVPESGQRQLRQQLAACLEAIVSMQLVPRAGGEGIVAAVEIVRRSPQISKLIADGAFTALIEEVESSVAYDKMQSMNQSLAALVIHGTITRDTAMAASPSPGDLDLLLRKIVGAMDDEVRSQGGPMAKSTCDFSTILELQSVKQRYDEQQARHGEELRERERTIQQLREQLNQLAERSTDDSRIVELEGENRRLAEHVRSAQQDYEVKLERLNRRVRELTAAPTPEPSADKDRRSFFRR